MRQKIDLTFVMEFISKLINNLLTQTIVMYYINCLAKGENRNTVCLPKLYDSPCRHSQIYFMGNTDCGKHNATQISTL